MYLLLTIISVLCAWTLLTVLVIALMLIMKPLQGTQRYMEKITCGVRAIDTQTHPLGRRLDLVAGALVVSASELNKAATGLTEVDSKFALIGEKIRRLFRR